MIEGQVENPRDDRIAELEDEVTRLRVDVSSARREASQAGREATRALSALRQQLNPLYRALQDVFGELNAAGTEDAAPTVNARTSVVWDSWKSRLGEGPAKIIDALLLHGEMNTQQLAIATGYHRTTVPGLIHKMNKAGLLNKNGGRFSLKAL